MANDDQRPESSATHALTYRDSVYRCVCGHLVELEVVGPVTCDECGRRFEGVSGADMSAEETLLATLCERKIKPPPLSGEEDPFIDKLLGHFRVIEPLGHGGMGTVYRALDESLQRYVALKVLRRGEGEEDDTKQVQQLFLEARAQARVNHPHVVHIYFVDRAEGAPFFAMEMVNGVTLKERLKHGPLPFAEVVRIGLQVARALEHALCYDIVHGDIKPSNILQTETGDIKLSDFGLARRLSELEGSEGTLAGTPNYLSPESAARQSTDFRSDFYSLGVTLFELTFGKLPYSYDTESVDERLKAHRFRQVEFPEEWPDEVPEAWRAVLERLLAKDRNDRYQDYPSLIHDLERARPLKLTPAGRFQRALAWGLDSLLLSIAFAIFFIPSEVPVVRDFFGANSLLLVGWRTLVTLGIPLLVVWLLIWWETTPGKRLFQLRVVDNHGQTPTRIRTASRMGMQFLIIWTAVTMDLLRAYGWYIPETLEGMLMVFPFLVEVICMCFTKDRLALHDRIFRTRVVLDAQEPIT